MRNEKNIINEKWSFKKNIYTVIIMLHQSFWRPNEDQNQVVKESKLLQVN